MSFFSKIASAICLIGVGALFFGATATASCDPCICGNGNGQSPPLGCCYGPFKDRECRSKAERNAVGNLLSQVSVQQLLQDRGGLRNISVEMENDKIICTLKMGDPSLTFSQVLN